MKKIFNLSKNFWIPARISWRPEPETLPVITLYMPAENLSFANSLCKQFEPRSRPTECRFLSGSKLFYTQIVVLGDLFVKT